MKNKGVIVTSAGVLISLALGFLYAWSIIKSAIQESIEKGGEGAFSWPVSSLNDPYSTAVLVFAFTMIFSGKIQDKIGPRITALAGTVLVTAGLITASLSQEYWLWITGFGILCGMGIGFSYAAITPACIKWFPPEKTGLIAGLVVSGNGLAPVYIAPLFNYMIKEHGLSDALLYFAAGFFILTFLSNLLLKNPPVRNKVRSSEEININPPIKGPELKPSEILRTFTFYKFWLIYTIGAGAGLMVIGFLAEMVKKGLGENAFLAVAILAAGNAGGRVAAGWISDKIGREKTMTIMLLFQSILMFIAVPAAGAEEPNAVILLLLTTLIGFNYGTNLSLFPSISKDKWGMKNFGINYGLLFTAWGLGGFLFSRASQMINTATGSFNSSFIAAGLLLIAACILTLIRTGAAKSK